MGRRILDLTAAVICVSGMQSSIAQTCLPHWHQIGELAGAGVYDMEVMDPDGSGPLSTCLVVVGPVFTPPPTKSLGVAAWDGKQWHAFGSGVGGVPRAVASFDADGPDGPGLAQMHVGGQFNINSGLNLGKWTGSQWVGTGGNVGIDLEHYVTSLEVHDHDGDGPAFASLFVGGEFFIPGAPAGTSNLARWDGTWSAAGNTVVWNVLCLRSIDDDLEGPKPAALYGGLTTFFPGQQTTDHFARLSSGVYQNIADDLSGFVCSIAQFDDDGPGPNPAALYIGGSFNSIGNVQANHVARWDGQSWAPLGSGITGASTFGVCALEVFDEDADGPALPVLVAGGRFSSAGGLPAKNIAKWDGKNWSALDVGITFPSSPNLASVRCLKAFDPDGPGGEPPALFVGGWFSHAGNLPVGNLAIWRPGSQIVGDVTCDHIVNASDLLAVIRAWGDCADPDECPADIYPPSKGDDVVNVFDLLLVIENWR